MKDTRELIIKSLTKSSCCLRSVRSQRNDCYLAQCDDEVGYGRVGSYIRDTVSFCSWIVRSRGS